jgi:flagellar assembly factor FliW
MLRIQSKALGSCEINDKQLIRFANGLFGFEKHTEFALLDATQHPFYWLQSLRDVGISFLLINPYLFRSDYVLEVPDSDIEEIGSPEPDDILVFAIVTVPEDVREMTANLQGPLIINRRDGLGKQSIHLNSTWKTRHRIIGEADSARDDEC